MSDLVAEYKLDHEDDGPGPAEEQGGEIDGDYFQSTE